MEYDIHNLDCSRMLINPLSPQLVTFMEKNIPRLKTIKVEFQDRIFTKSQVYRYILLLYDPHSEINTMQNLDHLGKKYESCAFAGFKLTKSTHGGLRFTKEVDDMVLGKNEGIVDMIVEFLAWVNNAKWQYTIFLKEAMLNLTRDALGRKITQAKSSQEYMKLYRDSVTVVNEMSHVFDETEDFYNRFYYKIEEARSSVMPEDYARALTDGDTLDEDSPYQAGYVIDKIRFLGDDEETIKD